MALQTTFNRLKREVGIKRCVILDGNVGDVYLNDKKQIVDLKQYLTDMLKGMEYDDVLYWDRIDGIDGDVSRLSVIDEVEVEGDAYSFDDDEENQPQAEEKTGSGQFKEPAEIFNIVFKSLKKSNRKTAFVLNWADYLFSSGGQLPPDERELITMLGKAIKDKKTEYLSAEVNESTVILITSKLAMFPISFYQGNPEVACLTLSKPDREERAKMMEKIESGFDVKLKPGETLLTSDKFNEYVDMLDDFTNREIVQMARLSRKEGKMPFEQLYLLFKYGEKDNPWEKLDYKSVKNIKKILSERVVGQEEAIEKIEKVVVKAYMGLTGIHKSSSRSAPKGVLFFVGPTGVGKTELSKALAKFLFGDEQACIRFDMSEYAQENSDQKLIGAPPGYVGYEEGGQLTNAVKEKPFSIILFDEIEKAAKPNPRILDIFLQILEDGRLTDSKGETVYFSESVIIFTSNLGASEVSSNGSNEEVVEEFIKIVKNYFDNEIKRPEILGRIGYSNIVGYDRDKNTGTYVINPEQEETVRMIYDLYSAGKGITQIRDEMIRRGRKDSSGLVRWENTKISRILHNATYKGYQGYLKSHRNNFLDQKIIKNYDEDTYLYIKGNYEPIISEEQWDRCKEIREQKKRHCHYLTQNGEVRKESGIYSSKDIWSKKLRCRCGYRMRRNKWHKNKSGEIIYGYKCYNQLNNGTKTVREQAGVDSSGACDLREVCDWKFEMMARHLFSGLWGSRKDILGEVSSLYRVNAREGKIENDKRKGELDQQIAAIDAKMRRLTQMRIDDELPKSEYLEFKSDLEKKKEELVRQRSTLDSKAETDPDCLTERIQDFLLEKMDFTAHYIDRDVISKFVDTIIPRTETCFEWYMNFNLVEKANDEKKMVWEFSIDFQEAKSYRTEVNALLRPTQWQDLLVRVYM